MTSLLAPAPTECGRVGDAALVARLRAGDEAAFARIVREWSPLMLHVARSFVATHASAEECVQDTWLTVIGGLDRFEGRSRLRTWAIGILINIARRRGDRDRRVVALDPTVDPERFGPDGRWTHAPQPWGPESVLLDRELLGVVGAALDELPARQRAVVALRDVHGLEAEEVCSLLSLTPANQRVLLHRGRAQVRTRIEHYFHS